MEHPERIPQLEPVELPAARPVLKDGFTIFSVKSIQVCALAQFTPQANRIPVAKRFTLFIFRSFDSIMLVI